MFEPPETPASPTWTFTKKYLAQLVGCALGAGLARLPLSLVLSLFGISGDHGRDLYFAGYDALLSVFVGLIGGWWVGRLRPSYVMTGRWIWLLPSVVIMPDMVRREALNRSTLQVSEYFFAIDPSGLGMAAVTLFTIPLFASIGYSLGMIAVDSGPTKRTRSIIPRAIAFFIGAILFLAIGVSYMHHFERRRIEAWSSVRYVIERSTPFSADPLLLCGGSPPSQRALDMFTMVQSLERRACGENQLLPPGSAEPKGSWALERVRVLRGRAPGAEGWVYSYGLMKAYTGR